MVEQIMITSSLTFAKVELKKSKYLVTVKLQKKNYGTFCPFPPSWEYNPYIHMYDPYWKRLDF